MNKYIDLISEYSDNTECFKYLDSLYGEMGINELLILQDVNFRERAGL
jgi:hypothetical protein